MKTLPLLFLCCPLFLLAQKIEYPENFKATLARAGIEFYEPVEAGYRDVPLLENRWHNSHFAIRSPREGLEIRFTIIALDDTDPHASHPNLLTFTTLTNVASNDGEALISGIQPEKEALLTEFNADWGITYFFHPKLEFSDKQNCRLMALCKEGKGTVLVFYLFNDPGNEALEVRKYMLRFL